MKRFVLPRARPRARFASACLLLACLCCAQAHGQAWPQRAVKLVVPYAAGGNTDTMARLVARHLHAVFGQPFIVENHVGAGGVVATELVARAIPDGYTLLFASNGQLEIQPHVQRVRYDPFRDFAPVFPLGINCFVLGVSSTVPAKTVDELVAYARSHPGALNYGSGGVGSVGHLAGAMFAKRAGVELAFVPYKGAAQTATALAAGEIQMYLGTFADVVPQAQGARIRLLAVSSPARDPRLPGVPALAERYPGFAVLTWNGLLAPAGTPRAIVERLAAECRPMVEDGDTAARLRDMGVDPDCMPPDAFAAMLRQGYAEFGKAAGDAGLRPE